MKQQLLIFSMFLAIPFLMIGQCGPSYSQTSSELFAGATLGQHFTTDSSCSGTLTTITISSLTQFSGPINDAIITLYEGNGNTGNVLATINNVVLSSNGDNVFDFSSFSIQVMAATQYTLWIDKNGAATNFSSYADLNSIPGSSIWLNGTEDTSYNSEYYVSIDNSVSPPTATFPDAGWELQGAHSTNASALFTNVGVTAPGPNPSGLDIAELPIGLNRLLQPVLVDLDDDGDLDIVSGGQSQEGRIFYFENTGTATSPNWVLTALPTIDAIQYTPGGNNELRSELIDIDDDNDYDLFVFARLDENGLSTNDIHYYENTGTASVPNFVDSTIPGIENENIANFPSGNFVDLDGDLDYDMVGMGGDSTSYFLNTGTKLIPSFERKYHLENPWDLDPGTALTQRNWPHGDVLITVPNFIDVDADGDFDMCFGRDGGLPSWIENIGTATTPDYGTYALQSFSGDLGINIGAFPSITFGDVDGDNVLDVVAGTFNPGYFAWYKGMSSALGVEDYNPTTISVYPNPAQNSVTINTEIKTVIVYDITGKKVLESTENTFDIKALYNGIYILEIITDNGVKVTKRLIKK